MKVTPYERIPGKVMDDDQMKGVSMRIVAGPDDGLPNFVMRVFEVDADGYTTHHAHDHEHEVFFFHGSGEVLADGEWVPVSPGYVAAIEGGAEHQIRAGKDGLKFICVVPAER